MLISRTAESIDELGEDLQFLGIRGDRMPVQ